MSKLDNYTLKDLPKKDKLITIDPDSPLPTVFETIFRNRISSAPVVDKENKLIGVIGIVDIIVFALNLCQTSQELASFFGLPHKEEQFADLHEVKNYLTPENEVKFSNNTAGFITNYSRNNLLQVVPPNTSFSKVIQLLTQYHRIAVGDVEISDYITQSDIIRFFFKEKDALGTLGSRTINDLGLGSSNVLSINQNERVIEAFKKMILHKVSGLGVVDDNSILVGQISSSDIKCISQTGEMIDRLYETYPQYRKVLIEKYKAPVQTITVTPEATFAQLIDTLATSKLHRVFVVQDNTLLSVISLTDVLRAILGEK